MGMEAYGLVGFYFLLLGIINILDLGLSPTMNREMARYSVMPDKAGEARDFVRTLEIGYWAVGILIGAAIYFASPHIATHWIKAGDIPASEVRRAVAIMGVLAALRGSFPYRAASGCSGRFCSTGSRSPATLGAAPPGAVAVSPLRVYMADRHRPVANDRTTIAWHRHPPLVPPIRFGLLRTPGGSPRGWAASR
jgi:hypothetical protein